MKEVKSIIQRIKEWIINGNDCQKCPCFWYEQGYEDYDEGCYAGRGAVLAGRCRLPWIIRRYLKRRADFAFSHQYDGIDEYAEEVERIEKAIQDKLSEKLKNLEICSYTESDGKRTYYPVNKEMETGNIATEIWLAVDGEYFKHHPNELRFRWKELLMDTLLKTWWAIRYVATI